MTLQTKYKFTGSKYDDSLSLKDISKLVRSELKEKYPECRFSITTDYYAGGQKIYIALTKCSFNPFATPNLETVDTPQKMRDMYTAEELLNMWQSAIDKGHHSINQFYIDEDYFLNEKGNQLAKDMKEAINQYNFDDSDSMTDYFHTNFYYDISFGKWDKELIFVNEQKQIDENIARMEKEQSEGKMVRGSIELITDVLSTKHPQL